jgi:hypothetical protein
MHYGASYDSFGPVDNSVCPCYQCDASFQQQLIDYNCVLGYPTSATPGTSRTPITFQEPEVLYTYAIVNNWLSMYYADEWPMSIGIGKVHLLLRSNIVLFVVIFYIFLEIYLFIYFIF